LARQADPIPNLRLDAVVIGAGAAGLFCAGVAGQRGLKVLLIDHADKLAEKIRISGGGRCNFTNRDATPAQFLSGNPDFCRSALARYTRRTSSRWYSATASRFTKNTRGSFSATSPATTSSRCCCANASKAP
jgi:predicted flavoprotein YhiN